MRLHPVQRKIYFTLLSVYDPRMTNAEEAKEESCSDLSESIVRVATYSVPITKKDLKYLRFIWRGQLHQFTKWPVRCTPEVHKTSETCA